MYFSFLDDDGFKNLHGLHGNQEVNTNIGHTCNKENYGNNFVPSTDQVGFGYNNLLILDD